METCFSLCVQISDCFICIPHHFPKTIGISWRSITSFFWYHYLLIIYIGWLRRLYYPKTCFGCLCVCVYETDFLTFIDSLWISHHVLWSSLSPCLLEPALCPCNLPRKNKFKRKTKSQTKQRRRGRRGLCLGCEMKKPERLGLRGRRPKEGGCAECWGWGLFWSCPSWLGLSPSSGVATWDLQQLTILDPHQTPQGWRLLVSMAARSRAENTLEEGTCRIGTVTLRVRVWERTLGLSALPSPPPPNLPRPGGKLWAVCGWGCVWSSSSWDCGNVGL